MTIIFPYLKGRENSSKDMAATKIKELIASNVNVVVKYMEEHNLNDSVKYCVTNLINVAREISCDSNELIVVWGRVKFLRDRLIPSSLEEEIKFELNTETLRLAIQDLSVIHSCNYLHAFEFLRELPFDELSEKHDMDRNVVLQLIDLIFRYKNIRSTDFVIGDNDNTNNIPPYIWDECSDNEKMLNTLTLEYRTTRETDDITYTSFDATKIVNGVPSEMYIIVTKLMFWYDKHISGENPNEYRLPDDLYSHINTWLLEVTPAVKSSLKLS